MRICKIFPGGRPPYKNDRVFIVTLNGMLTSLPSPTVELQAEHSVTFSLDNLRASAGKLWHVSIPVGPINPVASEHFTSWVAFIQQLFFELARWRVLVAGHGFIWNYTAATLPRHDCFLRETKQKEKIF